jgi:hypothetical protein
MKNIAFCLAAIVSAILLATPTVTRAEANPPVTLAKMRCVRIFRHIVHSLRASDRIEDDHIRCTVAATNRGSEPATFTMALRLDQPATGSAAPVEIEEQQKIDLGTGETSDAEIGIDVSENLNGCMPFKLTITVGKATIKKAIDPNCPD